MALDWQSGGVKNAAIFEDRLDQWMNRLEEQAVNLHGFCLVHRGAVVAERYFAPFHAESPHRMYSVGKSLTSIGVGLLEADGLVSLDDPVYSYFPEACPPDLHPYIRKMTVRDLLEMRTAHASTTYKRTDDSWVASFFHTAPDHIPGTIFSYDTSGSHVLSALIEKRTGMELMAYLQARALRPLALSEGCHFLKDPDGVSQGGSGLVCTLRDIAKIGWLMTCGGVWDGQQLLPSEYVRRATSKQVSTCFLPKPDERNGYGWQIWQVRNNGFAFYGLAGQWCICLPEQQLILTTTADTHANPAGEHAICQAFWDILYPCFAESTNGKLSSPRARQVLAVCGERTVPQASMAEGTRYRMEANAMKLEAFRLLRDASGGSVELSLDGHTYIIEFGVGQVREGSVQGASCLASGAWVDDNTFCMRVNQIGDELREMVLVAFFCEDEATVMLRQYGEYSPRYPQGFASGRREA